MSDDDSSAADRGSGLTDLLGALPEPDIELCLRGQGEVHCYTADQMRTYAAQQVAAERERCAKLCEQVAAWLCRDGLREQAFGAFDCAGNIRLRGWPNGEVSR